MPCDDLNFSIDENTLEFDGRLLKAKAGGGGGVTNPLSSDLDVGIYSIVGDPSVRIGKTGATDKGFEFTQTTEGSVLQFLSDSSGGGIQTSAGGLGIQPKAQLFIAGDPSVLMGADLDLNKDNNYDIRHIIPEINQGVIALENNSLRFYLDAVNSSGRSGYSTDFEVTTSATSFTVSAGVALLRSGPSENDGLVLTDIPGLGSTSIDEFSFKYIYAEYNGGTPRLVATDFQPSGVTDGNDRVLVNAVLRDETGVHALGGHKVTNFVRDYYAWRDETFPFTSSGGFAFAATTNSDRRVSFDGGVAWLLHTRYVLPAFDSDGTDRFTQVYNNGNLQNLQQWNNTHRQNDSGDRVTAGNGGMNWYYRSATGRVYEYLGNVNESPDKLFGPSTPDQYGLTPPTWLTDACLLTGQIIFESGEYSAEKTKIYNFNAGGGGGGSGSTDSFVGLVDTPGSIEDGRILVGDTSGPSDQLVWTDMPSGGGVSNPMTEDLDGGGYNISNLNTLSGRGASQIFTIGNAAGFNYHRATIQNFFDSAGNIILAMLGGLFNVQTADADFNAGVRLSGNPVNTVAPEFGLGNSYSSASIPANVRVASGYETNASLIWNIQIGTFTYGIPLFRKTS